MEITKIPSKILGQKTQVVGLNEIKKGFYRELVSDMKKAMKDYQGIGLAANQIGKDLSIFVIEPKLAEENGVPDIFINPEITEYSKESDSLEEGCLSIPQYYVQVKRAKKVKIKFIDENGNKKRIRVRGFLARVLQHETDHLCGITIKDRIRIK